MAEEFAKALPLGRVADVQELADVITFLATPAASYITGSALANSSAIDAVSEAEVGVVLVAAPGDVRTRSDSAARLARNPDKGPGRRTDRLAMTPVAFHATRARREP